MPETIQYSPLAYEEIMKNCPTLRALVEGKISEEVAKKQAEIDELKARAEQTEADNISAMLALTEVYEILLGGAV